VEHRAHPRQYLRVPITFLSKGGNRTWVWRNGVTRDLGTHGAYIIAPDPPPRGARLIVQARLPLRSKTQPVWIVGQGLVVRTDVSRNGSRSGFAVRGERFVLTFDEGARATKIVELAACKYQRAS